MDPTGGAGVWRDAWTLRAVDPDLVAAVVVTALTRQGHGRPAIARAVEPERFGLNLERAVGRLAAAPDAVKIGLLPRDAAPVLAAALREPAFADVPVVLDPVLRASDGGALGADLEGYGNLVGRVGLWTPNGDEARIWLEGRSWRQLPELLRGPVLLKGGHALSGPDATDRAPDGDTVHDRLLFSDGRVRDYMRPRAPGPDVRGTGCALASAVTAHLARGAPVELAVTRAIAWLDEARTRARTDRWDQRSLPVS